jgi:hypothetical protein
MQIEQSGGGRTVMCHVMLLCLVVTDHSTLEPQNLRLVCYCFACSLFNSWLVS